MPARRRVKEIQRRAERARHPDLRGFEVEPVGVVVQTEDAWSDYEYYHQAGEDD